MFVFTGRVDPQGFKEIRCNYCNWATYVRPSIGDLSHLRCNQCRIVNPPPNPNTTRRRASIFGTPYDPMYNKVKIIWNPLAEAYDYKFTYNETAVNFIKLTVPTSERAWLPDEKKWIISEKYLDLMKGLFQSLKYGIEVNTREDWQKLHDANEKKYGGANHIPVSELKTSLTDELNAFTSMVKEAGYQVPSLNLTTVSIADLNSFYRKAAMKYHPDRNNGKADKMTQLNVHWMNLKQMLEPTGA